MTNHLMIDLETLSTSPRAALLQAGWCIFDPAGAAIIEAPPNHNVNIDSCLRLGGEVSDGTIRWWMTQSPQALASMAKPGIGVSQMILALVEDYRRHNCKGIWSNGSCFDIVIIQHYMTQLGIETPWKFWDIMDTRTAWAMAAAFGWCRTKGVVAHTAREDAIAQVIEVQTAWRHVTVHNRVVG